MKRIILFLETLLCVLMTAGCVSKIQDTDKLRDLEYTILEEEAVPKELKEVIEEKKEKAFRLTYADQGVLYIAKGYGTKEKTGYRVEVAGLYETEGTVCLHTHLLGPEKGEETKEIPTYPYIVVKLEGIKKRVEFK